MLGVRDLVNWGIDTGNTTPEKMRLTVAGIREAAPKLIESGLSQGQAAKILGVAKSTLQYHLAEIRPKSERNSVAVTARNREQSKQRNQKLQAKTVELPQRRYGTVVIDPPWDMEKIERQVRPNQAGFDYPTMTEAQLAEFPLAPIVAADCHLFCWATQRFLPAAMRLTDGWGFKYIFLMTWHKPGGFQPHGLPQYNSEFIIYARRGAAKFADTQAFNTCFQGERREHSRKPDVFYDTVRRVTPEGRIDIFSREKRAGFEQYGNEVDKFEAAE
jgi:N6-adenosine-specific RNA methylase IME4